MNWSVELFQKFQDVRQLLRVRNQFLRHPRSRHQRYTFFLRVVNDYIRLVIHNPHRRGGFRSNGATQSIPPSTCNMESSMWNDLLSLESRYIVQERFGRIHSKNLSARRVREINAATKLTRECFRSTSNADYSERSLLSLYSVANLSRVSFYFSGRKAGKFKYEYYRFEISLLYLA